MTVQFIEAKLNGDHTLFSSHSSELLEYGWKGSCSNLPAAYLTGLLCGLKAKNNGVERAVLDIGLRRSSKGARVFGVLKGALDAGIEISHDSLILPSDDRVNGLHIAEYANLLSSTPEIFERRFSKYLSQNLDPRKISDHLLDVKNNIVSSFGDVNT
jgi:large subunit ribosomal protein L18